VPKINKKSERIVSEKSKYQLSATYHSYQQNGSSPAGSNN